MDTTEHLEGVVKESLDFNLRYPQHLVELERKKNMLQAKLMAAQLEEKERVLHEGMPESLRKVLDGKRLLLWRSLLEKYGYDDLEIFEHMSQGVSTCGEAYQSTLLPRKGQACFTDSG